MYPTLYHAVHSLLGLDLQWLKLVNTFGFFIALAFLAGARCLASELGRKHASGTLSVTRRLETPALPPAWLDIGLSCLVAFAFGFKIFGIASGEYTLQGGADTRRYMLSANGDFFGGLLAGIGWLVFKLRQRRQLGPVPNEAPEPVWVEIAPREHVLGLTGYAALGALIGAKLFHLLERPRAILELLERPSIGALFSGLTIYGGVIVGALFALLYCRRHALPFLHVCTSGLPGLMLGYAIGRLGCQLSGDGDWGIVSQGPLPGFDWLPPWFWAFDYPNNVMHAGVPLGSGAFAGYGTHLAPPVYPTPLYESLASLASFALLWSVRRRIERPLVMFGLYLVLNGAERFWIEKIRVNAGYDLFGRSVTQAEIISVLLFVAGVVLLLPPRKPARATAATPAIAAPEPTGAPEAGA